MRASAPALSTAIFVAVLAVYWASPVRQMADSRYSLLVCEALLRHGTLKLDRYFAVPLAPERFPDVDRGSYPYQVEPVGPHLYSFYPPGTPLLTLPLYAALLPLGFSAVDEQERYDFEREERAQALLASIITAGLSVVFFATARRLLPATWSLLIALGAAFGTPMWSTASRALWSDTWGIGLLGLVILLLVSAETTRHPPPALVLATLVAWTFFVKPAYAVPIAAISAYALWRHRSWTYLWTGLAWLAAFVAFSYAYAGRPLPTYYVTRKFALEAFWPALTGGLLSPSRGLLTTVPVVLVVIYLVGRNARRLPLPGLALVATTSIAGHLLLVAFFPLWWAGHSFGARYMTGLVPWLVLLAVLGLWARLDEKGESRPVARVEVLVAASILAVSVAIQARGAIAWATAAWNYSPDNVDSRQDRLWDWGHAQALAGLVPPVYEPGTTIAPRHESANLFLLDGFGGRGQPYRPTIGGRAVIWFDLRSPGPATLLLDAEPFLDSAAGFSGQTLELELNGHPVARLLLNRAEREVHSVRLTPGALERRNRLVLLLPEVAMRLRSAPPGSILRGLKLFALRLERGP